MGVLGEAFGPIWELLGAIKDELAEMLPKAFKFTLWVLSGIIILPCVYIAGNLYPKWVDWSEKF